MAHGRVVGFLGVEDIEIAIVVNVQRQVEIELYALRAAYVECIPLRLGWRVPIIDGRQERSCAPGCVLNRHPDGLSVQPPSGFPPSVV